MNKRFISVLAFALIVSAGATLLFYRLIAGKLNSAPKTPTTQIVVAARNLPVGTLIRDVDLTNQAWLGSAPQGALVKKEDIIGRGVVATIYQGEPFVDSRLAPKGAGAGMAAIIPPGMRAVAVRVNEVVGVAGFVVPGMRVDVLIAGTAPGVPANLGTLSKTLLQNIEVLSAGQNIQKDTEGKPISVQVVNLLVTPEQAEVLSLASNETRIQLVLRNPLDNQIAKTPGTAVSALFSGQKVMPAAATGSARPPRAAARPRVVSAVAVKETPPPPVVVEVIQGGRKTETKFGDTPESKR